MSQALACHSFALCQTAALLIALAGILRPRLSGFLVAGGAIIDTTEPPLNAPAASSPTRGGRGAIAFGLLTLAFGLYCEDWRSTAWAVVALVVWFFPLAMQWSRWETGRVYALWFGLFMIAQTLLTPVLRGSYVALPPNIRMTVDVRTESIPGYPLGRRSVSTDERGWRVQPPVDYMRKGGARVFAIGGSTTEDILLDDRSTWTHRLQGLLELEFAGLHVVNTGASGLRASNHVATLEVVAGLQPDLVLILLGGNDWNKQIKDHFEPGRDGWTPPALRETAMMKVLQTIVVTPLRRQLTGRSWADRAVVIDKPGDLNGGRTRHGERQPHHRFEPATVTPGYAADVERLGRLCVERALQCMFFTQPHAYGPPEPPREMVAGFWMTPPFASYGLEMNSMRHMASLYNSHLKEFALRAGHGLCDIAHGMPPSQRFFYDDMHFTDEGATRVAGLAAPCVRTALRGRSGSKP